MTIQHIGTKRIETDRLIIRRFTVDDAGAMFNNWANDIDVCKFLTWDPHGNIENTRELLARWTAEYENDNVYNWVIEFKETGEVIGSISAVKFSDRHLSCEIGYCISKKYWAKGITTEALKALIKFFFTEVGVNRIQAQHDTQNIASGKVMEKSGMVLEGTLRQRHVRRDGSFGDGHIWAILRDDYVSADSVK